MVGRRSQPIENSPLVVSIGAQNSTQVSSWDEWELCSLDRGHFHYVLLLLWGVCGMSSYQEKVNCNLSHNVSWQTENSSRSQPNELKGNQRPTAVLRAVKNEPRPTDQQGTTNERGATKPDHEAYPSLPGTPEPYISEFENVTKQPKRKSLPPELITEKPKKEVQIVTVHFDGQGIRTWKQKSTTSVAPALTCIEK